MTSMKRYLDIHIGMDDQTAKTLEEISEFYEVSIEQIVIDALGAHMTRLEWERLRFDERAEEAKWKASSILNPKKKSEGQ